MGQHIYLDTNFIIPLLWDRDPDQRDFCRSEIDTLRGEVRRYEQKTVRIPKLVIGEAVNKYIQDVLNGDTSTPLPPKDPFMSNLLNIIEDIEAESVSLQTDCWEVARQLRRDDRELGNNDLFIAASAITDPDSTHLPSTDDDILETRSIKRVAGNRDSRDYGLTVSNQYH